MPSNLIIIIILGVALIGGLGFLILGAIVYFSSSQKVDERVNQYIRNESIHLVDNGKQRGGISEHISEFRDWINSALSSLSSEGLKRRISSAYWPITDVEYILILIGILIVSYLFGWLVSGTLFGGIGVAFIAYFIPGFMLTRSIQNRRNKFQDQLVDVLVLIRGAVQSGYGLLQSLDVIVGELTPPSSEEFGRVVREVQLGLSLNDALINLAARMESDDLQLVVTAIGINTQVGGSLSTMLTAVTNTIRARFQLFGEIRALTSYARYASYLLSLLPFITGIILYLISPQYFAQSLGDVITQIILAVSFFLIIIGNIWLRRIAKIEV